MKKSGEKKLVSNSSGRETHEATKTILWILFPFYFALFASRSAFSRSVQSIFNGIQIKCSTTIICIRFRNLTRHHCQLTNQPASKLSRERESRKQQKKKTKLRPTHIHNNYVHEEKRNEKPCNYFHIYHEQHRVPPSRHCLNQNVEQINQNRKNYTKRNEKKNLPNTMVVLVCTVNVEQTGSSFLLFLLFYSSHNMRGGKKTKKYVSMNHPK